MYIYISKLFFKLRLYVADAATAGTVISLLTVINCRAKFHCCVCFYAYRQHVAAVTYISGRLCSSGRSRVAQARMHGPSVLLTHWHQTPPDSLCVLHDACLCRQKKRCWLLLRGHWW